MMDPNMSQTGYFDMNAIAILRFLPKHLMIPHNRCELFTYEPTHLDHITLCEKAVH